MQSSDCRTRETLKKYLAGWIGQDESLEIEAHLLACAACEQTISGLEDDPDTLINFLRPNEEADANGESNVNGEDAVLQYALAKAKNLVVQSHENPSANVSDAPPKMVGPYELTQSLGRGSMGAVYLARHQQLGKKVAIKLLSARPFRNDQFTARFQREIRAAGSLNHPSIINATDAGQSESVHFLVMEYIDGMDLSRLTRLTGPLSICDACNMMQSVALGLSHAHAAGIVHRDIKPSNLMLSRTGQVKILDFGLAQVSLWDEVSAELTTVGQLMGTIDYMAPEQAERADTVDYRADLYSLGATLFKLLCGRAPLAATPDLSPLTKLRLLATSQPPSLGTLRPDAPSALVQLVSALLARDPGMRPASAAHAAEMLAEFSTGADLPQLIRVADEKKATEPESSDDPIFSKVAIPKSPASMAPFSSGGWSSYIRWAVATAVFAFVAAAGVLITIETQKGQLVIESMDANTEIKISKSGKVYDSIQLVPGANTTRLYAGEYEISIGAGSDQFQLDRDTIEIKRGETIVARVLSPKSQTQLERSAQPKLNSGSDPAEIVYDGKTLSMWLVEFARERSPEAIKKSLAAISSLSNKSNQDRTAKALLAALPDIPSEYDEDTFGTLWRIAGGGEVYVRHLLNALDAKNETWTKRVLTTGCWKPYQKNRSNGRDERETQAAIEQMPIVEWIAENVLNSRLTDGAAQTVARNELVEVAGDRIMTSFHYHAFDQASEAKYLSLLRSNLGLGPSFWLRYLPEDGQDNGPRWNRKLVSLIESKAVEYFLDLETPENYVAQSAMLLVKLSDDYDRTGMDPMARSAELVPVLARRLHVVAENPHQIPVLIDVDPHFDSLTVPSISNSPLLAEYSIQFVVMREAKCLLVHELFDLVECLKATGECSNEIRAIHDSMVSIAVGGGTKLAKNPFNSAQDVRFNSRSPGMVGGAMAPPGSGQLAISWPSAEVKIDGRQIVSRQEFLAIAICNRAENLLTAAETEALRTKQSTQIQTDWVKAKIVAMDRNNDRLLTHDEAPFQEFEKIDSNSDMQLSHEEILEYSKSNGFPRVPPPSRRN